MAVQARSLSADRPKKAWSLLRITAAAQGVYFSATGIWPLIHMRSFLAVTGPKVDLWLVETVAVLVLGIGLALLVAAARDRIGPDLLVMVLVVSIGLASIDTIYPMRDRIWNIYLLDAIAQLGFILLWSIGWFTRGRNAASNEATDAV